MKSIASTHQVPSIFLFIELFPIIVQGLQGRDKLLYTPFMLPGNGIQARVCFSQLVISII